MGHRILDIRNLLGRNQVDGEEEGTHNQAAAKKGFELMDRYPESSDCSRATKKQASVNLENDLLASRWLPESLSAVGRHRSEARNL